MLTRRSFAFATVGGLSALAGGLLWQLQKLPLAPTVSYVLLDGQPIDSRSWRGKVVLVNFWATSCATCVKEMPMLARAHQKYQSRGFDIVAVAMQYDPPDFVARFAQSRQLPFGVAIDNTGAIAQAFGNVRVTPSAMLVDKQGHIVKTLVGEIPESQLHALVEELLNA